MDLVKAEVEVFNLSLTRIEVTFLANLAGHLTHHELSEKGIPNTEVLDSLYDELSGFID